MPEPSTLDRIRNDLKHAIEDGTSAERKALIEHLVAGIRITDDHKIIPMFWVPVGTVRAMLQPVGRAGLELATRDCESQL